MSTATTDQDATANTAEMTDPAAGLVDLDKPQDHEVANPGEGPQSEGGDDSSIDDVRSKIYKKHSEQRQKELTPEPAEQLDPDEEITIKVNGRERQVLRSKVDAAGGIEAYQKNAAASEMLNQASAEARRVREQAEALAIRERDIADREQRLKQALDTKPTPPTEPPTDAGALKSLARQYHEAMLDGDFEKADELLLQINAAQSNATAIDPEEIANRAVQRARAELEADERRKAAERFEADRQAAVASFPVKHKDLASNPDAFGLVDAKTIEVHREHPDWSAAAIIDEAASRARALIKSVSTSPAASTKLEAKRSMTQIRGGSARTVPQPAPAPQTKSNYVAELRRQRGLDT